MKTGWLLHRIGTDGAMGGKIENNRHRYFNRQFAANFCDILAHHYQIWQLSHSHPLQSKKSNGHSTSPFTKMPEDCRMSQQSQFIPFFPFNLVQLYFKRRAVWEF